MMLQPINKTAIVLLHYFGGAARSWDWMIPKLSDYGQVIALDLPGFGGTTPLKERNIPNFARHVLDEIRKKEIEKCVLVGHSMGGKIALMASALDKEDRIEQLILIAPSPPTTEPMEEEEKKRMLNQNREEAEKTVEKSTVVKLNKEKLETAVQTQLEVDNLSWKWWIEEGMAHSIADVVKDLSIPVRVLASEDDPVMTPKVIEERVMPNLPGAELRSTKNIGHLIPMEDPEWTARMINECLTD